MEHSRRGLLLSDGTLIRPGDALISLHAWNERLEHQTPNAAPLARGNFILKRFRESLRLLNATLDKRPAAGAVKAVKAEMSFVTDVLQFSRLTAQLGFDLVAFEQPVARLWRRALWDNLLAYLLMWTFSPRSLEGKGLTDLIRTEIWISRERLSQLYG